MPATRHSQDATERHNQKLAANFSVKQEGWDLAIYLESGDGRGRNPDYNERLCTILERLASASTLITEITVASTQVAGLSWADKQLRMAQYTYPIRLGAATDVTRLRRAIGAAQEPVGQSGAKKGGNRTKRIRISIVAAPPYSGRAAFEWEHFLTGHDWAEASDALNGPSTAAHFDAADLPLADEVFSAVEGERKQRMATHRARERQLRKAKVEAFRREHHGRLFCEVPDCGFDFEEKYGTLGRNYAHVHHLKPLAELDAPTVTTLNDLAVVCANCHAMIHRGRQCRALDVLIPPRGIRAAG